MTFLITIMTTQQVWTKYAEDLKRFILSKVKDEAVTDDILQDSFIKIHTKLHTLRDLNKLKAEIESYRQLVTMPADAPFGVAFGSGGLMKDGL